MKCKTDAALSTIYVSFKSSLSIEIKQKQNYNLKMEKQTNNLDRHLQIIINKPLKAEKET